MRERLASAVERILSACAKPSPRVLEIGCGTGLLLGRIASRAAEFLGTDFSPVVIDRLERELASPAFRWLRDRVRVRCQSAEDFRGIEAGRYDLVILHSVVQYFPDVEYLLSVLEGAVGVCAPGGVIFLGDVRNLLLHEELCAAVELARATPETSVAELRERAAERRERDEELLLDPAFFAALPRRFPRLREIRVEPRAEGSRNELNCFRYDVTLRLDEAGGPAMPPRAAVRYPEPSPEAIRDELARRPPRAVGLSRVLDARIAADVRLSELLLARRGTGSVAELRREIERSTETGLEPAVLFDLARQTSHTLIWNPVDLGRGGRYDAVFVPSEPGEPAPGTGEVERTPFAADDVRTWANDPLQTSVMAGLASRLRSYLGERLPFYMVPAAFVVLCDLPLLPNGKIDRQRLPAPSRRRSEVGTSWAAPRNVTEERLLAIWCDVLGLDGLGVDDDFFELGGHSLLATQVLSRIRQAFEVDLPLRRLFEKTTVAELAAEISGCLREHPPREERGDDFEELSL